MNALAGRATSAEAAAAARQACDALGILVKDQQFITDVRKWDKDQFADQRVAFKRDLGLFLDAFLVPERAILAYARLDGDAQERILMAAATTQASIDMKLSSEQILSNVERLRADVCATAGRLDGINQQQELIQEIRREHEPGHFHAEHQGQQGKFDFSGEMTIGNIQSRTALR